jgi:hypothetical protein
MDRVVRATSLVRFWLSLELARRWRSLVVLGLLVALASGVVLASVAGGRRGSTAADRLTAATSAATVMLHPFESDARFWAKIRALPEVEALTTFPALAFAVDDLPDTRTGMTLPPGDSELFRTIEVPVILDGRIPDPGRVDEVAVTPRFREIRHKGVGDTLTVRLLSPTQAAANNRESGAGAPAGPAITARVVGVVRSSWFAENPGNPGGVIASPALFARYRANIIGADDQIPIEGLARLRGGAAAIPAFRADLRRTIGMDVDVQDLGATVIQHRRLMDGLESSTLWVLGAAAALAACVLVGQAIARYAAATAADLASLRALGMTLPQQLLLASAGPVIAGAAGSLVGVGGAVVASNWMPIGSAALHEPAPGIDIDPWTLGLGGALVVVLVAVGAAGAALTALTAGTASAGRRSTIAHAVARAGLPVPIVVGARFALEPGRGRRAVAVRPALVGAVVGVIGVITAFTFAAGVADAAGNPARFGQTQQLEVYLGFGGEDAVRPEPLLAAIARESGVAAVNDSRIQVVRSGAATFPVFTYHPVGGPLRTVLSEGRLPNLPDEITLGRATAARLGAHVGDRVPVGSRPAEMTVTGIGFVPSGLQNTYAEGAWATAAGFESVRAAGGPPWQWHVAHIALDRGADPAEVMTRLRRAAATMQGGDELTIGPPASPPPQIIEINDIAVLPVLLGAFLAVLAAGAVGHALVTAVRRRRHEVGILRALGMTRRQVRLIVVTQAGVLAVTGLVAGIPLGLALGRTAWRLVAAETPIQYVPPSAPLALALIVPATLLAAGILAAWPSRAAARLGVAHLLRAE